MAITSFSQTSGLQQYEQLFTSSGTWTKPDGVKTIEVTAAGGGSTGVGAGAFYKQVIDVSSKTSIPITVGAAGGTTKVGNVMVGAGGTNQGDWYDPTVNGSYFYTLNGTCFPYRQNNTDVSYSAAYGNGIYVTVGIEYYGGNNYGRIATSTDGYTWTDRWSLDIGGTNAFHGVVFGAGKFVAQVGNTAYYSTDGITWTASTGISTNGSSPYMSYVGGKFFISNGVKIYTSVDGVSWSLTLDTGASYGSKIAWNGTYYLYMLANYGSASFRSTDGYSWTQVANNSGPTANTHYSAPYSLDSFGGYFIFTVSATGYSYAFISSDGVNWSTWASVYGGASSTQGQVVTTPTRIYFINNGTSTLYYATSVGGGVTAAGNKGGQYFAQANGEQLLFTGANTAGIGGFALGRYGNQGVAAAGGGAGSAGYLIGTGMNTPGIGVDGWCNGSNATMTYAGTQSWGSAKNQGAVLVRWWA